MVELEISNHKDWVYRRQPSRIRTFLFAGLFGIIQGDHPAGLVVLIDDRCHDGTGTVMVKAGVKRNLGVALLLDDAVERLFQFGSLLAWE